MSFLEPLTSSRAFKPNHLLKVPSLRTVTLGIRFHQTSLWGTELQAPVVTFTQSLSVPLMGLFVPPDSYSSKLRFIS